MKLLILTKRFTSAKDISRESLGRPSCLFATLAAHGHDVCFLLADYREHGRFDTTLNGVPNVVRPLSPLRLPSFRAELIRLIRERNIDILVAEGDPLFAVIARGPCKKAGVPLVYDLMDNYETYASYRLPLVPWLDTRSLKKSCHVVCVTGALREKIRPIRQEGVSVIGNGVDPALFRPMDKAECRGRLGLPSGNTIIGHFGHLAAFKGAEILREAFTQLRKNRPGALLLLAGRSEDAGLSRAANVRFAGMITHRDVPLYLNACDAVLVPNPDNAFTRYSFPLKILEGLACNVPVVATALPPVIELLGAEYPWIAAAGDARELAVKIEAACSGTGTGLRQLALDHSWETQAHRLAEVLEKVIAQHGRG